MSKPISPSVTDKVLSSGVTDSMDDASGVHRSSIVANAAHAPDAISMCQTNQTDTEPLRALTPAAFAGLPLNQLIPFNHLDALSGTHDVAGSTGQVPMEVVHEAQLVINVDANDNQVVVPVIMEAIHEAQPTIDVDAYDEQAAIPNAPPAHARPGIPMFQAVDPEEPDTVLYMMGLGADDFIRFCGHICQQEDDVSSALRTVNLLGPHLQHILGTGIGQLYGEHSLKTRYTKRRDFARLATRCILQIQVKLELLRKQADMMVGDIEVLVLNMAAAKEISYAVARTAKADLKALQPKID